MDDEDPAFTLQIQDLLSNTLLVNHLHRIQQYADDDLDEDEAFLVQELSDEELSKDQTLRRRHIQRDREGAHKRLVEYYFAEPSLFGPAEFKRQYRMSRE